MCSRPVARRAVSSSAPRTGNVTSAPLKEASEFDAAEDRVHFGGGPHFPGAGEAEAPVVSTRLAQATLRRAESKRFMWVSLSLRMVV